MPLLLTEADVRAILTMPLALEAVETSFRRLGDGEAASHPRRRLLIPGKAILNYMAASDSTGGYLGLKIYSIARGKARFLVPLFRAETGEMAALIEADYLGQMRTGAASGVAAKVMARADARTVAIIGTGLQARTQLEAVAHARKLEGIRAFGRDVRAAREIRQGDDGTIGRAGGTCIVCGRGGARGGHRDHLDDIEDAGGRRAMDRTGHAHQCHRV